MVTVTLIKRHRHLLARQMLKAYGSVDQPSITETQPSSAVADARSASAIPIARRANATSSIQGSAEPLPFSSSSTIRRLARFFHDSVPASTKLGEQRRLTAARTSGDHNKAIHAKAFAASRTDGPPHIQKCLQLVFSVDQA
jgi:hypothetical protein